MSDWEPGPGWRKASPWEDRSNGSIRYGRPGREPQWWVPLDLPTEPGLYLDKNGTVMRLDGAGWASSIALGNDTSYHKPIEEYAHLAPFHKLEPRAETAKAVIETLKKRGVRTGAFGPTLRDFGAEE